MHFGTWLAFLITESVLSLIPGPAVVYVVSTALRRGFAPALAATTGVLGGNTLFFILSATGLVAVLLASHQVFLVVKYLGSAYLIYLGARALIFPDSEVTGAKAPQTNPFVGAFLVQTSNPKAILFFVALYPQFINPHGSVGLQFLILGITSVVAEFFILAAYAGLASRISHMITARFRRTLDRIGGAFLVAIGGDVALQH